jgi:hypothetical protein
MLIRALSAALLLGGLSLIFPGGVDAQVRLTRNGEQVDIVINGKPFTSFHFGSDAPKSYLHPLRSVNGTELTRGFPLEIVPGEDHSDPHHRGLWFTHGDVNGVDLWTEGPGQGRIVLKTLGRLIGGAETGSLNAEFEWQDGVGKPLVEEDRTMSFTQVVSEYIIEFRATLRPAGVEKVTFGDTKNGSFAIRVSNALNERSEKCPTDCVGSMTNSEGGRGEKEIWGKRANWVDFSGEVDGQKWGIAMFDHPSNPGHPTAWHARGYGLLAANPFGAREFSGDKTQKGESKALPPDGAGGMTVQPGSSLTFRYRVLVHAGDAVTARLAEQYRKWAQHP